METKMVCVAVAIADVAALAATLAAVTATIEF